MSESNQKTLDDLLNHVSVVEASLEFLEQEINKHGGSAELMARAIKEVRELKILSDKLDKFCKLSDGFDKTSNS